MTNKKIHMSPTRAFKFRQNPLRALQDYLGESDWYESDDPSALLYGTIVHNIAEDRDMLDGFSPSEKELLLSSRGPTKGQLKSSFSEAETVGKALRDYVEHLEFNESKAKFEVPLNETNEILIDDDPIEFNVTGRADMLTEKAVYDFKTVANNEFKGFVEYGSFRDGRELNYIQQVAFYAHMFEKEEAHILYIQKNKTTPFIYDYKLTEQDLFDGWADISEAIVNAVEVIVRGKINAKAVNDGSLWAFNYFGGLINDNKNDQI